MQQRTIAFLESPIVLAPIAGPGTPELTAAAANAGAFAFLACAYSHPAKMRRDIARVRELTDKPFGLNLFIEQKPADVGLELLVLADQHLDGYRDELSIPHRESPPLPRSEYHEQMRVVLDIRPRAFSFTFGIPDAETVKELKQRGIFTLGTATSVEEAVALQEAGIDAVCAQGAEAGGHRGSFLHSESSPLIGTLALVPQVIDAVSVPVIASGGITDGRGVAAVLALGATAAQLGTAFLLATEAGTNAAYRRALATAASTETVVTQVFSWKAARGIANRMTRELADPDARAPYPHQNVLTRDIRDAAAAQGRSDFLSLWAGQAFPLARAEPAGAIVRRVLAEARSAIEAASLRLSSP